MAQLRFISADSHVMEPANFWVEHVDKKFKDQAPRVVAKADGQGLVFTGPGLSPFPVAGGFGTGRSGEELKEHLERLRGRPDQRMGPGRTDQGSGYRRRRSGGALHHAGDAAVRLDRRRTAGRLLCGLQRLARGVLLRTVPAACWAAR